MFNKRAECIVIYALCVTKRANIYICKSGIFYSMNKNNGLDRLNGGKNDSECFHET